MNYLAHIYLSGNDPDLIFGNFIADAVPGKQYKNYSNRIQEGIILHREIDSFTDCCTNGMMRNLSGRQLTLSVTETSSS